MTTLYILLGVAVLELMIVSYLYGFNKGMKKFKKLSDAQFDLDVKVIKMANEALRETYRQLCCYWGDLDDLVSKTEGKKAREYFEYLSKLGENK